MTAFPVPISPAIENLMHSLLVYIFIDSERLPNSLQILLNSFDGMVQIEVNSVSGMPRFSLSRFIKERLNSEIFYPPTLLEKYALTQI
jgi:hypothetical protein